MGPKPGSIGSGHSAKTVLPSGMLVVDSGAVVAAHSVRSTVVGVAALEHSASASRIATGEIDAGGAASRMAPTTGSSAGVGRTG
jgi:hypothetical protein